MKRSGIPRERIPVSGVEQSLGCSAQDRNLLLNNLPDDLINNDIITMGNDVAKGDRPVCVGEATIEHSITGTQTYQGFTNNDKLHVHSGFDQGIRGKLLER